MYDLNVRFMTKNDCYVAGRKITPKGIMIHSTATPGVMAGEWFDRWNKSYQQGEIGSQVCVHAFVDDRETWQYLPWNHRGWHSGGKANDTHIGIELCEPAGHRYEDGSGGTMFDYDVKKNEVYFNLIWDRAIRVTEFLCRKYGLVGRDVIDHSEGYRMGIASNHGDVGHWFPKHGKNMDLFREEVDKRLQGEYPSEWARDAWEWAKEKSYLDGMRPKDPITREEFATVLKRIIVDKLGG